MDGLRQKLENQGLKDVVYMVINDRGEKAQQLHPLLAQRLSENIALYKQSEQQPDVWQTLNGKKDDFLIYDRFVFGVTFTLCRGKHITATLTSLFVRFLCKTFNTFLCFCHQVRPPHSPHITSIFRYWTWTH